MERSQTVDEFRVRRCLCLMERKREGFRMPRVQEIDDVDVNRVFNGMWKSEG